MDFKKAVLEIAKSYEDEGYTVIVEPGKDRLPDFASDFGPNLLATRANDRVLVEVKRDRGDLERDPVIVHHAELTSKQPGWRFDLHILERDDPLRRIAKQPTTEQIDQMLSQAEALLLPVPEEVTLRSLDMNELIRQSAFLRAWAGLEAAIRQVLTRDDGRMEFQPTVLTREIYATGRISFPEFQLLERNRQIRNSLVHGFGPITVESDQVRPIIELARKLLVNMGRSQSA